MEKRDLLLQRDSLECKIKNHGNWFYWIAGLSLANALFLIMAEGKSAFIFGLGAHHVIDLLLNSNANNMQLTLILLSSEVLISAILAILGVPGCLGKVWGYIVGTALYLSDTLLLIWYRGDIKAIIFHVLALMILLKVFLVFHQYRKVDNKLVQTAYSYVQGYAIDGGRSPIIVNSHDFSSINSNSKNETNGFKTYRKDRSLNNNLKLQPFNNTIKNSISPDSQKPNLPSESPIDDSNHNEAPVSAVDNIQHKETINTYEHAQDISSDSNDVPSSSDLINSAAASHLDTTAPDIVAKNDAPAQVDTAKEDGTACEESKSLLNFVGNKFRHFRDSNKKPQKIYSQSYIIEEDPTYE